MFSRYTYPAMVTEKLPAKRLANTPGSASVTGFSGNADIQPAKASTIPPPANTAPQRLANQRIIRR